jgi:von Willebrand factor type A domain
MAPVFPAPSSDDADTRAVVVAEGRAPIVHSSETTQRSISDARTSSGLHGDCGSTTVSVSPASHSANDAKGSRKNLGAQGNGNDSALATSVPTGSVVESGNNLTNGPLHNRQDSRQPGQSDEPSPANASPSAKAPRLRPRKRRRGRLRHLLPAWSVSLFVHVVILTALAAATFTAQERNSKPVNFDSALAGYRQGEREELNIWADPANIPRDQTIGTEHGGKAIDVVQAASDAGGEGDDGGGVIVANAFGAGAPSATPRFRGSGKRTINERNSLPNNLNIAGIQQSPLNMLPAAAAADLYGGGLIAGDPVFDVKNIGAALDQLAREILRHLKDHKLTVVWLFDESTSMQDDQRSILEKFDRVSSELKKNIEPGKKSSGALNHAIVGFGEGIDFVLKKPTLDIDEISRAIKKLRTDMSGIENTMHAIVKSVEVYADLISKDRKMLIVLVTDESSEDGADVEEARQALKKYKVPLYVIGRQSLFGYQFAHHRYVDPVTKDVYHPVIHRGPETAYVEIYQWDGLYDRWDEQPSGFAPWELARLTKDSGGIYFVLPSEEFMRIRQRERAYSSHQLKEYQPEYNSRKVYVQNRTKHPLRQFLFDIIGETKGYIYRRDFPIDPGELTQAAAAEIEKATVKLSQLLEVQRRLETMKQARDREPEKRWQAHYDLMLAQTVAFEVKAYEYRALMNQIIRKPPLPSKRPTPDLAITFVVDHAKEPLAPRTETAKKYAEAKRLLEDVIQKHPSTPWADLARDTLDRGFSVKLNEWHHNPKYAERSQFVPKY